MKKLKIEKIDFHRNGVCGLGFFAAVFVCPETKKRMVASVFETPGAVAVYDIDLLNQPKSIEFGFNSWRGDHYEDELRAAIKKHVKKIKRT